MPTATVPTKIKPIVNFYKRAVVVDISSALGVGISFGYFFWYGFHMPIVRHRDRMYAQIEDDRIRSKGRYTDE